MINHTNPRGKWRVWILFSIVVIIVGWLGVAWFLGFFPFSYKTTLQQQAYQKVYDSLTATGTSETIPNTVLKELTATSSSPTQSTKSSQETPTITSSVLDSLTPKR